MESKTWLWKRKTTDKTNEKEKALELEKSLEALNEQLSSVRTESSAKDDILAKQAKVAEDAIAGWEKAEAQVLSLKKQLDDALLQKRTAEERVVETDIELEECRKQLNILKEDQQLIVKNAAFKISREQEKVRMLEQRLVDTNKKFSELVIKIDNLSKILEEKEQLLREQSESKSKLEVRLTELVSGLDASEKLNASSKYEVCILKKELEIRNDEREFNRRSTETAHRQHLESIKKIAKLETECQRLRVMLRKRLPGTADIAKVRNEVDMLGNNAIETRKKRSSSLHEAFNIKIVGLEKLYDAPSNEVATIIEKLRALEAENKVLKESLAKKNNELEASHQMFARTATKLSQVETRVEELSKGQAFCELRKRSSVSCDQPLSSISEHGGSEDNISCAESWASALISELEHFKSARSAAPSSTSIGMSELSLMDDFVEMERLAVITMDKHFDIPLCKLGESKSCVTSNEPDPRTDSSEVAAKDLAPIKDIPFCIESNDEHEERYVSFENYPIWLKDILKVIVQKHHITQKSLSVILEDVKIALSDWDSSIECDKLQQPKHTSSNTFDETISTGLQNWTSCEEFCQPNLEKPVSKLIELVEEIIHRNSKSKVAKDLLSGDRESEGSSLGHKSALEHGYVAQAFLWDIYELTAVLQNFVSLCNDLLNEKSDLQKFTEGITRTFDWIINHCFSLQDVSDMKETIRKHMDADESHSEYESKYVVCRKLDEHEDTILSEENKASQLSTTNGLYILSRMEGIESKLKDEIKRLNSEIMTQESRRKDLEEMLKTSSNKNDELIAQLHESKECISNLQMEVAALKKTREQLKDQIKNYKLISEDLETQLTVLKAELKDVLQKSSSSEVELAQKSSSLEELEATCIELQLQLENASSSKDITKYSMRPEEMQIQAECDTIAASEKLSECQETIFNLEKQLKALALPGEAVLMDKVISSPTAANSNRWPQLPDHIKELDHLEPEVPESPKMQEIVCAETESQPAAASETHNAGFLCDHKSSINDHHKNPVRSIVKQSLKKSPDRVSYLDDPNKHKSGNDAGMLIIIPKRQGGASLLRKLLQQSKRRGTRLEHLMSA